MNENNFSSEFILPEELQKKLDDITDRLTVFITESTAVLYGEDFEEENWDEFYKLILPKVVEGIERSVNKLLEEWDLG